MVTQIRQILTQTPGPNPVLDDLLGRIGALPVAGRTYGGDDPYHDTPQHGDPFSGAWSG